LIRRNLAAIQSGRVELKRGSVGSLPFVTDSFEKVLTINSMQYWPDTIVGLREIRRVMKSGGMLALRFTPYSGQSKEGLVEPLTAAGFTNTRRVDDATKGFCVLALKT
jgi:ubiquinone/menaquinone biosynthesis C-methylase UbiE